MPGMIALSDDIVKHFAASLAVISSIRLIVYLAFIMHVFISIKMGDTSDGYGSIYLDSVIMVM